MRTKSIIPAALSALRAELRREEERAGRTSEHIIDASTDDEIIACLIAAELQRARRRNSAPTGREKKGAT